MSRNPHWLSRRNFLQNPEKSPIILPKKSASEIYLLVPIQAIPKKDTNMLFSSNAQHVQSGFSLVELLIVVAIIGILAAIAAPLLLDAQVTSRRTAAISNMRLMHTAEHNYFTQNSRYANLSDLNTFQGGGLGTMATATELTSNGYSYQMVPPTPSATSLATDFAIEANGLGRDNTPIKYMVSTNGTMQQLLPVSRYLAKFE